MAVHKDCYAPIGLTQQGGPHRRETLEIEAEIKLWLLERARFAEQEGDEQAAKATSAVQEGMDRFKLDVR
ncbi:hypothetical protein ACVWXL_000321 [Bradyrhizobium sp. GM22.5]